MNNYEEIKKLLSASRKMINESNSQLQEDIKHAHANSINTYIEEYVGIDAEGNYREKDSIIF